MYPNYRGITDGECIKDNQGKSCYIKSDDYNPTAPGSDGYFEGSKGYDTNRTCDSDKDCEQINICSKTESKAPTFGHTPQACSNSYMRFSNVYNCTKQSSNYTKTCTEDSKIQSQFSDNGCCIYHPRVQITDNWGWCNGVCPEKGIGSVKDPGGKGCYDKSWAGLKPDNECGYETKGKNNPYTPTSSIRVIVAPK